MCFFIIIIFSSVSGELCLNQSKTPVHKYLFVYSFYTQLKVIKGTTVIDDNMVLQGGEKHCNSCGATTRKKKNKLITMVTFCTVVRINEWLKPWGKTKKKKQINEKKIGQARSATSHFIYLLQSFCTIFSGALFKKTKKQRHLSLSILEVCFLQYACKPATWAVMFFVIHTLKSKAVGCYFFSSVAQAWIITVQLLACATATGQTPTVFY